MKRIFIFLCIPAIVFMACAQTKSQKSTPVVSAVNLGKQITVEGWAVNSKIGAKLVGNDFDLWVDGLTSWPTGYYPGGERGVKLKVTGILVEDSGLPVFIPKKDEPLVQGIPVVDGTDLKKASHRYLLKNAVWQLTND